MEEVYGVVKSYYPLPTPLNSSEPQPNLKNYSFFHYFRQMNRSTQTLKKLTLTVLLTVGIIVGFVAFAYAQSYGSAFLIEYNTDRQGGDIRAGFPVSRFSACMDECASSSQCRAFVWVSTNQQPPDYNNARPLCWLKHSVPGKRRNSGMVSGVKQ